MPDRHTDLQASPVTTDPDQQAEAHRFAVLAAGLLRDDKCQDVRVLDVRGLSQVCDYIVIATGTSDRQMTSARQHLEELAQEHDRRAFGTSREAASSWIIVDFVDVVIHLFEANARAYYDLEMLWGDAPRIAWRDRPDSEGNSTEDDP